MTTILLSLDEVFTGINFQIWQNETNQKFENKLRAHVLVPVVCINKVNLYRHWH